MPKQINTASVGQKLVRLFSLKGRFQPVLDEVIVPVVSVDPEEAEAKPGTSWLNQAAVAAEYGYWTVFNPLSSGKIITLERMRVWSSASAVCYGVLGYLARTNAAIANAYRRTDLAGPPDIDIGTGTTAVSSAGNASLTTNTNANADTVLDVDIYPGYGFLMQLGTVNIPCYCTVSWSEREIVAAGYIGS